MGVWRWVGLAVTACVVIASTLMGSGAAPIAAPPPAPAPAPWRPATAAPAQAHPPQPQLRRALRVLTEWDQRRAAAWRASDAAALRLLYKPGSRLAATDLALLRRWQRAGWRVERLDTQLLRVRLVAATRTRLVLRIRDRLAGGVLRRGAEQRPLSASRAATRTVTLVVLDGGWRVSRTSAG